MSARIYVKALALSLRVAGLRMSAIIMMYSLHTYIVTSLLHENVKLVAWQPMASTVVPPTIVLYITRWHDSSYHHGGYYATSINIL